MQLELPETSTIQDTHSTHFNICSVFGICKGRMSQKSNPGAVPKGDVSYLRATQGPIPPVGVQPAMPGRDNNHTPGAPQPHHGNNDWEERMELQQRELEEVRARAAQMEKTMRWWSDCTANWREKWSKVRNERNKAREENRQLRSKLDATIKEINLLKREKDELVSANSSKLDSANLSPPCHASKQKSNQEQNTDKESVKSSDLKCEESVDSVSQGLVTSVEQQANRKSDQNLAVNKDSISCSISKENIHSGEDTERSLADDKLALLEMKLEESQKTIAGEREEKCQLTKSLEEVQRDLSNLKLKYEEQKMAKYGLESQIDLLKEQHKDELGRIATDLEDEQSSKTSMDRRLSELRAELEKLQKENADEWGKRERLETEKLGLERENKKLRGQIADFEEQLERKSTHATTVVNKDIKTLQMEVSEKTKELADLKHVHMKLKKSLQERVTDLEHSKRRSDQFEMEVKKLRARVEELKRELATAEDEVDTQTNNVRKVQRNNDELQQQVENLQVQLEHLQSRLKRSSSTSGSASHSANIRSFSPDLQALEIDDETDDDFSEGN